MSIEELREDLRSGRRFRAHRHNTGADCTYEVLIEVLTAALPGWKLPSEDNVGAVLDVLWKGASDVLDERPRRLETGTFHRRSGNTSGRDEE